MTVLFVLIHAEQMGQRCAFTWQYNKDSKELGGAPIDVAFPLDVFRNLSGGKVFQQPFMDAKNTQRAIPLFKCYHIS